jgi:hypothetical protein
LGWNTETLVLAESPPYCAVTLAIPPATPVTTPVLLTATMAVFEDDQPAWAVMSWVLLSVKVTVAASWLDLPMPTVTVTGDVDTDCGAATGTETVIGT